MKLSRLSFIASLLCIVFSKSPKAAVIKEISVPAEETVAEGRIKELLGIKVGDVYSEATLDKGLKRLANTGRYQGLEVYFNPHTGRVVLETRLFDVLQEVRVDFGKTTLAASQVELLKKDVLEISSLAIKDQISIDALSEIRERIEARMKARGFLSPQVVLALQEGENLNSRILLVNIKLNTQSMVQAIKFKGFKANDLEELRRLLEKVAYTRPYLRALDTPNDLINNPEEYFLERIRRLRNADKGEVVRFDITFPWDQVLFSGTLNSWGKRMRREGFFDFSIQTELVKERDASVLEITLNRGQKYDIQFLGNVNFWERKLRDMVLDRPIRLGIPFNLNDARNIVQSAYLAEGFLDVKVTSQIQPKDGRRVVTLSIQEGPQYFLGPIFWEGISVREREALSEIEQSWKDSMSHPFHHIYFDEKQIRSQLPLLLAMLKAEGYLQARFLGFSTQKPSAEKLGNRVGIKIPLQLGPKFRIRSIVLEDEDNIRKIVELKPIAVEVGEVASSEKILSTSLAIRDQAKEAGFLLASTPESLDELVVFSDSSDEVDLDFRLNLGPKVKVGQIVTEGLRKTREKVILREFEREDMTTGDVWVPSKLEKIDERLLAYGLFNNLRMQSSEGRNLETTQGDEVEEQERDLRVILSERPGGAVEFGPGYRTDLGMVAFGELNYRNLSGLNRSVVFRAQISRKLENYQFWEQKYSVSLLEPYTFGVPFSTRLAAFYEKRDERQFDSNGSPKDGFNVEEVAFSIVSTKEILDHLTLRWNAYTLSVPRIFDLTGEGTTDGRLKYRIATMGPQFEWDKRDNIFNPSRGFLLQTNLEYSGPAIGSGEGVHFILNKNELSYYKTLRRNLILAFSGAYSYMKALGEAEGIPENRRLVLGGRTTIRSLGEKNLRFDQSGVDQIDSALFKAEIRQGLFGDVGMGYFFDVGKVSAAGFEGEGWRQGAGVGIRYLTPVGPLALDFAFNLDKKSGEDFSRILFSVGVF